MKFPKIFGASKQDREANASLEALQNLEAAAQAVEQPMHPKFARLVTFLNGIPGVKVLSQGGDDRWWIKLNIDLRTSHSWNIVQEFGWVMNELSMSERLPTVFKPVSPPPYMNGGPTDCLSWVIECEDSAFPPGTLKKWLEERLPKPADDLAQWEELEQ